MYHWGGLQWRSNSFRVLQLTFVLSVSFHRCSVLVCTYKLLVPKGKTGKSENLKKLTLFQKSEIFKLKSMFTILVPLGVSVHETEKEALLLPMLPASGEALLLFIYCFKAACPLVLLTRTTKLSVSVVHRWNDPERKTYSSEINLSHCHFGYHKSHVEWPGI